MVVNFTPLEDGIVLTPGIWLEYHPHDTPRLCLYIYWLNWGLDIGFGI